MARKTSSTRLHYIHKRHHRNPYKMFQLTRCTCRANNKPAIHEDSIEITKSIPRHLSSLNRCNTFTMTKGILWVSSRITQPSSLTPESFCDWYENVIIQTSMPCLSEHLTPSSCPYIYFLGTKANTPFPNSNTSKKSSLSAAFPPQPDTKLSHLSPLHQHGAHTLLG